jgi:hypothetical protein
MRPVPESRWHDDGYFSTHSVSELYGFVCFTVAKFDYPPPQFRQREIFREDLLLAFEFVGGEVLVRIARPEDITRLIELFRVSNTLGSWTGQEILNPFTDIHKFGEHGHRETMMYLFKERRLCRPNSRREDRFPKFPGMMLLDASVSTEGPESPHSSITVRIVNEARTAGYKVLGVASD